jgi:uncharacterized protein
MMAKETTLATLDVLKKLQGVDRQLFNIARMKEYEPKRHKDAEAAVAAEEARLKELDERHVRFHKDMSRKELDIKGRQEKINKLKSQLLTAGTNREYQAFQKEIGLEEVEKAKIEEELLEMMIGIESFAAEEVKIKGAIGEHKKTLESLRAEVNAALAEMKARETGLVAHRGEVASKLDPDVLSKYEGLFRSRNGEAVVDATYEAGMSGEEAQYICKGCFMPLTHQMVNLLLLQETIVTCKSCGRILYIADPKAKG